MISNPSSQILRFLAIAVLALGLAACNSSGGSSSTSLSTSEPDPGTDPGSDPGTGGTGTGVANLTWVAPTQRVNGDPLSMSELGGYKVYAGTSPSDLQVVVQINDPYDTDYEVTGLSSGTTYYFYVTATDATGLESPPSETKQKTI